MTLFPKFWEYQIYGDLVAKNPYADKGIIPIGTIRSPLDYESNENIPKEEIVFIPFDTRDIPLEQRKATNILMLGGSGDGKSKLMSLIRSTLSDAGFYTVYIDPKSFQSGYAKKKTEYSFHLPPKLKPRGIKIKHYFPYFMRRDYEDLIHNFDTYSLRLHNINEKEMWMGLGATSTGASKFAKTVQAYGNKININLLRKTLNELFERKEIVSQSYNAILSLLSDLEDTGVIDEKVPELNLLQDFKDGFNVCISYNPLDRLIMSFDIGLKIRQCFRYQSSGQNEVPIMFFFDDSSLYADRIELLKYNLSIKEIQNIGYNYRSRGIYNCMAVQSLGIVDKNVAESYKYKIITPQFNHPESLLGINVPKEAIWLLQYKQLISIPEFYINQCILIDENNKVTRFFPFNPMANNFRNIYHRKKTPEQTSQEVRREEKEVIDVV